MKVEVGVVGPNGFCGRTATFEEEEDLSNEFSPGRY